MGCDYNIETSLAQLKTTMRMDVLHSQTIAGVLKELTVVPSSITWSAWSCGNQLRSNTLAWSGSASQMPCDGSARQEAAAQEFPIDDQTPANTASAAGPASARRLT
jgi:hypothetical protein